MQKLVGSLLFLLLACGPRAFAQNDVATKASFPPNAYTPLPPHFQPRRLIAADMDRVSVAPPLLPFYAQPAIPAQGYLWVPGFWAWRKSVPDYFWVPGTWVQPPQPGLLWTPPYWSRVDGGYAFRAGYWATEVGFYGGINYGYGYTGDGYQGAKWENGDLSYNRATNNLGSAGIAKAYDRSVNAADNSVRVSFNGGHKGTAAQMTRHQGTLTSARHIGETPEQRKHFELAAMDRSLYSKLNNGEPGVAATPRAEQFDGNGITHSRGEMSER
jgi:WXXGXW repeat (2 copies)